MSLDLVPMGDVPFRGLAGRLRSETSLKVLPGDDKNHLVLSDGDNYLHVFKAGTGIRLALYGLNDGAYITGVLEQVYGVPIVSYEEYVGRGYK